MNPDTDTEAAKPEAPRERLFRLHDDMCKEAKSLMRKKNMDYGGDEDPFRNFRMFGTMGFLVRMSDKLARLRTFSERGKFDVQDEGTRDSLIDLINYSVLLQAYLNDGNK